MALACRLWGQPRESFINRNLQWPSQMSDHVRPMSLDSSPLRQRWIRYHFVIHAVFTGTSAIDQHGGMCASLRPAGIGDAVWMRFVFTPGMFLWLWHLILCRNPPILNYESLSKKKQNQNNLECIRLSRRRVGRAGHGDLRCVYPALTATICWNIVVYKEERQVYGLLLDAQLPRLAADQQPNTKDITCEQLPSCHMTCWPKLNRPSFLFKPTLVRSPPRSQRSQAARQFQTLVTKREVRVYPARKDRSCWSLIRFKDAITLTYLKSDHNRFGN